MRARLVGDDVGLEAGLEQLRQHARRRCRAARRDSARPSVLRRQAARHRVVEVVGLLVEVARLQPPLDAVLVDLDAQRDAVVHGHRQRLRAAHAAEPGGQRDRPGQRAAVVAARDLGEALVGALHDALGADVDPRPGGHLPVHRQPEVLEAAELVPRRPLRHEVGVGDQHPRRPLVRAHHADRLARLHEQRLVALERAQRPHDRVERVPRARRAPGPAVDDELVGVLGDVGVEVVHQHPQDGLLRPALAGELDAARRADLARTAHAISPTAASTARSTPPLATSSSAAARSGARWRSGAGPGDPLAHRGERRGTAGAGLQRRAQVEPVRGARQLDREDAREVGERGAQLACGRPAHRDVILLHRARRQRADARGARQPAVLGDERGLRVLGDHEAGVDARLGGEERRQPVRARGVEQPVGAALGDPADLGDRDGEEVEREAERRAVEVAARLDAAVRQHHRVVDRARQLAGRHPLGVGERVARGAVDLRRAAQRVGVLHAVVVVAVAGDDR